LLVALLVALTPCPGLSWRATINDGDLGGSGQAVVLDGAGDVVAAGSTAIPADPGSPFVSRPQLTVVKLKGADGTRLWRRTLVNPNPENTGDGALAVAVNGSGTAFAAGLMDGPGTASDLAVAALDGGDGSELWLTTIDGTAHALDEARAIVATGDGAVVVAGILANAGTGGDLALVKLRQTDGSELWREVIDGGVGGDDRLDAIALDPAGDVLAVGSVTNAATEVDMTIVKVRASDGALLWRRDVDGAASRFDRAWAVAVDAAGDVVAAGYTENPGTAFTVVKVHGSDGTELWRRTIDVGGNEAEATSVAVDGAGDVVAAGVFTDLTEPPLPLAELAVVKLAGATGAELWRRTINGTATGTDIARAVAVDGSGDVFAAGDTENVMSFQDLTVVKLAGPTGNELWRRVWKGLTPQNPYEDANAIAVDAVGHPVAVGVLARAPGTTDFTIVAPRAEIRGDRIKLVDDGTDPSRRKLAFRSSDPGIKEGGPTGPSDPTVAGATLELLNPTTGERDTFDLPAANWRPIGAPPGSGMVPAGYVYRDRSAVAGPCRRVDVRNGRVFKATCGGSGIHFSLDEPTQGSIGVLLRAGSGVTLHCLLFDGSAVRTDVPTTGPHRGVFSARDAAAPAVCPD
jgi:outer membrane protein assembly factor BamB